MVVLLGSSWGTSRTFLLSWFVFSFLFFYTSLSSPPPKANVTFAINDTLTNLGSDIFRFTNVNVEEGSVEVDVVGSFDSTETTFIGVQIACNDGDAFYANGLRPCVYVIPHC